MKKFLTISMISLLIIALTAFIFFSIRQIIVNREIESEWQATQVVVPQLAATTQLEIIPLYEEASGSPSFIQGHGVSYLIRTDSATLLLDVGNNPEESPIAPFMQNMQALGIEWNDVSRIVISHPHPDHVGGAKAWQNHTVSIGNFDLPEDLGDRLMFVPTSMTFKNAVHATVPTLPAPDVATTGVISYLEVFPISLFEPKGSEQALVVHVAGKGLVLITGCGHPGLEKLVERAETLYEQTVVGVVGGLHYENMQAEAVRSHIQFLQSRPIEIIALSAHDSSPEALAAFEKAFPGAYHRLAVGEAIHIP
jgi:7,8-dihydropterin-6-yl-methyl-4-(beta-D-ribofuranosyl)aminobenzene 5'-phosphate synthase